MEQSVEQSNMNFINSVLPRFSGMLGKLQEEAEAKNIPIIPHETACFLRFLVSLVKPFNILEIGTAVGFSAALFCEFMPAGGHVTTIDRFDVMIKAAKENFARMSLTDSVTLIEGDAAEILPSLTGKYDIIFLDAGKGQYMNFLPDCTRLLKSGGILIADDVLQNGVTASNRYAVPRRQRTIHKRMRNFLWEVTHSEDYVTTIMPIGDGLAVCYKA